MKRKHIFEFEDLSWFPRSLRGYVTDVLKFFLTNFKTYDKAVPILAPYVAKKENQNVLDMCSGSGGPAKRVFSLIADQTQKSSIPVVLTDKYPASKEIEAFDVLTDSKPEASIRSMFSAFHHFRPWQCKRILEKAAADKATIFILEFTERSFLGILFMFVGLPITFLCTPFMKPFKWSRLFWTYVIPLGPLILLWDGIVSCLRSYKPEELLEMTTDLKEHKWVCGTISIHPMQKITYLIGEAKPQEP